MGIIALSISSRQQANGLTDPDDPACPVDPGHPLVKNGHYWRHADTLPPTSCWPFYAINVVPVARRIVLCCMICVLTVGRRGRSRWRRGSCGAWNTAGRWLTVSSGWRATDSPTTSGHWNDGPCGGRPPCRLSCRWPCNGLPGTMAPGRWRHSRDTTRPVGSIGVAFGTPFANPSGLVMAAGSAQVFSGDGSPGGHPRPLQSFVARDYAPLHRD